MRTDFELIASWIPPQSRVLDLGCGDGALLAYLQTHLQIKGYGLEIDLSLFNQAVERGVSVIQMDLEQGLADFATQSFDFVLMTQTLQTLRHTEQLLAEMLRVGKQGVVTFPNFGHWHCRWQLLKGKMPVNKMLPFNWYDTPNLHLFTIADFEQFCAHRQIVIRERAVGDVHYRASLLARLWPNLLAEQALYRLSRNEEYA